MLTYFGMTIQEDELLDIYFTISIIDIKKSKDYHNKKIAVVFFLLIYKNF